MKHFKYLWYVLRHKWFVFIECCKLGIPLRGLLHDLSKFKPSEWFAYVNKFYGEDKGPRIDYLFQQAWLHHQRRNKHHWQYWILQKDDEEIILEMPRKYEKEMLADWIGAGKAITGSNGIKDWYRNNRDKIKIHQNTRLWIENKIYTGFDNYWEKMFLGADKETIQIVNDWRSCKNIYTEEYNSQFTEEQKKEAHGIILEAVSSGLG